MKKRFEEFDVEIKAKRAGETRYNRRASPCCWDKLLSGKMIDMNGFLSAIVETEAILDGVVQLRTRSKEVCSLLGCSEETLFSLIEKTASGAYDESRPDIVNMVLWGNDERFYTRKEDSPFKGHLSKSL